jgi:hypothetical protein
MIKIDKALHNGLKEMSRRTIDRAMLFVLTDNDKGILTAAHSLPSTGNGCSWMPGVKSSDLTQIYIALAKKNMTPSGLAVVQAQRNTIKAGWSGTQGSYIGRMGLPILYYRAGRHVGRVFTNGKPRAAAVKITKIK